VIPKARRQGLRLLITPDTILRWHRDIVRRRWTARSMRGKTGRPTIRRNIRALVRRLARENPGWGYRRIHGELAGLGVKVAASTVWEILKTSGTDPGRRQTGPTWSQFLRSQAQAILACDFFTVDLLDGTQAYVLAVIEQTPRMNAIAERWIGGCRREVLDRTLIWNLATCGGSCTTTRPTQSAPAAPLSQRRRTTETAARARRSCPAPHPKTSSGRRPDQRISPGGVTWTKLSARTAATAL
jgi:hypothetical protein